MSFRIKQLEELMSKKNFIGVSRHIMKLNQSEISEARKFIANYFDKNTKIKADDFWHFAAVISTANWLLFRDAIVENRARFELRANPSISNKSYFKELLKSFADNDENIVDIHAILSKYRDLVDKGCLYILYNRTREFLWPDAYSILCEGAGLSFSDYKKILLRDKTICSLFEYANILVTAEFKGKDGKYARLTSARILERANELGDSPEERMIKDTLMVYCNRDMESEACDFLCKGDFKAFKACFYNNYREKRGKNKQANKSNSANKDGLDNHTFDLSSVTVEGYPLRIIAYKEGHMALSEPFDNFKAGIVYPQNVTLRGQALPYDTACKEIRVIFESEQKVGFKVIDTIVKDGDSFAVLGLDFKQLMRKIDLDLFKGLRSDGIYPIEIVSSGQNFKKVKIQTTNLHGYLSNEDYRKSVADDEDNITAPVAIMPQNENSPIFFGSKPEHHIKINREAEKLLKQRYKNLFNNLELRYIKPEDKSLIDLMLTDYPSFGLDAKRMDIIEEQDILCKFDDSSFDASERKRDLQVILDGSNFWVTPKTFHGTDYLIIFNQNSVVLEIEVRDYSFYLKNIYDAKVDSTGQKILDNAKYTYLKIKGSKIRLFGTYDTIPADYNAKWNYTYISRLAYYFEIKNKLQIRVETSLENTAKDFKNQALYLKYQIDKEIEKRHISLYFSPQRLRTVSGDWQDEAVSLMIDMSSTEYIQLMGFAEDDESLEDEISVNTIVDDKIKDHCRLTINVDGEYILKFLGSHKNCAEYLKTGVTLQGDANIEHLKMQSYAIKDFTREDTLFRDLIGDNISIPDWHKYDNLKFFNKQFDKVEAGNNQPEAVKKALALEHKGVLLIQGPPGTGKTTTIVEIVRQLILQRRKVLVCSQSHAAVGNIYDKLSPYCENILRVDSDDHNSSQARYFNSEDYKCFLANNITLLSRLRNKKEDEPIDDILYKDFVYSDATIQKQYRHLHHLLASYYKDNKDLDNPTLESVLVYLEEEAKNISGSMLETQIYQSKDVILGTCIGLGMNRILKNDTVHFDTVIIDEAAKANLAETIVPMRMGDRFILVGDDNQLPPYVDQGEIEEMVRSNRYNPEKKITSAEMVNSQNKSLFEYLHYHRDPLFPEECLVTLNYQYRMNPEIGNFISSLFYDSKIHNGEGTDKQDVFVQGFPNPVTIIDTSGQRDNHESSISGSKSHRNICEARYICDEVLPKLTTVMLSDPNISVGIISPYASQCDYIRSLIRDQKLRNAVHTIDSIQGMEFDIVVFSFVRSFRAGSKAKVGFVDDMKRLNVSLSRAKKKLIVVGDMQTLTNPDAHYEVETEGIKPLDVFKKLASLPTKVSLSKTNIEHFFSSGIEIGEILPQCSWNYGPQYSTISVSFDYKERHYSFLMKVTSAFKIDKKTSDKIDLKYKGLGRDSKPYFGFASLKEEALYGYFKMCAKCIDTKNYPNVTFKSNDEVFELEMFDKRGLRSNLIKGVSYYIKREKTDLVDIDEEKQYNNIKEHYKYGDLLDGVVTGSKEIGSKYLYFVNVEGYPCGCFTNFELEEGSIHTFSFRDADDSTKHVNLNYNFRNDK